MKKLSRQEVINFIEENSIMINSLNNSNYDIAKRIINLLRDNINVYNAEKVSDQLEDYLFEKYCIEGDSEIIKIVKSGYEK